MKLIKCYIENFGKLSSFTYDFADGWNVIIEDNGYGKSTLAAFLKAMFYGLANTGKTAVSVNERKHYMPWQGGAFGGTVLFETKGKRYLIERFFGEKDKDETFVLYDADTNLESMDYSCNIGEELFLLDREAFEKSVFMPQLSLQTGANDSISAKLSNLEETQNDMNHFELARANLEKKQKELLRIGEKGKIWELRHKVSDLERKLKELDGVQENLHLWNGKRKQVEEEQKKTEEKLALLKEELKHAGEYEQKKAKTIHYQELKEKLKKTRERLSQIQAFFPEKMQERIEEYTQLDAYFKAITTRSGYAAKLPVFEVTKEGILKERKSTEEKIAGLKQSYEEAGNKEIAETQKSKLPYIAAVLFLVLGVGFLFIQIAVGIVMCLVGIASAIWGIRMNGEKARLKKEELVKREQEKEQLLIRLDMAKRELAEIAERLDICEGEMEKTTELLRLEEEKLDTFFREFHAYQNIRENDYMTAMSEIKEKAAVCVSLQEEVLEQEKCVRRFETENSGMGEIAQTSEKTEERMDNRTLDVIQRQQNECYQKLQSLMEERSQINRQIDTLSVQLDEREDLSSELEHERLELLEAERKHEMLSKTIKYLEKAKDNFSTRYLTKLKESFDRYMEILNEEITGEAAVDTKLKLKITQGGKKRDLDFYSAGYRDLFNLCIRLAMIDALYEKEKPFLILDDPFVNMDAGKLKRALAFVKRLSWEHQIIYFACHESRR